MMNLPDSWVWRGEQKINEAVVIDIDGVLSNADGRQSLITPPNRDWKGFFSACGEDLLIEETAEFLRILDARICVILLTGRPLEVRSITVDWLEQNSVRWDLLIMRNVGNYAGSRAFKLQTVRQLRLMGFDLRLAFEDDPRNRLMFQEEGIACMYMHSGYHETKR